MGLTDFYDDLTARLRAAGEYIWPLGLRLILFWEFWESGVTKLNGSNWFSSIQDSFPPPVSWLPASVNWAVATWAEIIGALLLLFGLFTRIGALALLVITVVATVAVHWPGEFSGFAELWKGYAISDDGYGNFKLPLLFMIMLLPLIFYGGGRISLDNLLVKLTARGGDERSIRDLTAAGIGLLILALPLVYLLPVTGFIVLALAIVAIAIGRLG